MAGIQPGNYVFAGGYENVYQRAYLNGELKTSQSDAWAPNHSSDYWNLGRWKTTPTTIPLRFSTFKLWNSALPEDELKALSSQNWSCSGASVGAAPNLGFTTWDDGNTAWDVDTRTNEPATTWDRRR